MMTTIVGYMNAALATINVRPLPSGVSQVVLVERADVFALARHKHADAMGRIDEALIAWSERARRDVTWRSTELVTWCGPIARGGELHRELWRRGLKKLLSAVRAWDPIEERWVPIDPGPAPKRPPAPLDEDDDDNAASTEAAPRDFASELGAKLTGIRVAVARRQGAVP